MASCNHDRRRTNNSDEAVHQVDDALRQGIAVVEEQRDLGLPLLLKRHQVALVLRFGQAAKALVEMVVAIGVIGGGEDRGFGETDMVGLDDGVEQAPGSSFRHTSGSCIGELPSGGLATVERKNGSFETLMALQFGSVGTMPMALNRSTYTMIRMAEFCRASDV